MNAPRPHEAATAPVRWGPSPWLLFSALALVVGGVALWWSNWDAPAAPIGEEPGAAAPQAARLAAPAANASSAPAVTAMVAPALRAAAAPRIPRLRDPNGDQTPDLADYVNEGETPTMTDVITRLNQAGVRTGLGAFQPPGTRPALIGLAVPEDFNLPEGYVRHHQATDDGQRIEAILMFAPGYQAVDASGHAVDIPANRVVPPELAPPGLPLRRIALPAPVTARPPGS